MRSGLTFRQPHLRFEDIVFSKWPLLAEFSLFRSVILCRLNGRCGWERTFVFRKKLASENPESI